ncbi:isochorismate synthase [Flavobacterium orientale]|jgi:isochorismate synthase|uniref:isochorismate synthase n=1 Tax=Flavobacterium orientale TaxID=1756020 RepID=A0A917DC63_9FLAO|nr:isochorismate synthase [Flavobacterium orientale]GGD24177.1 hypothetical protein GCM10011343_12960 [Flavobacterium orientale]
MTTGEIAVKLYFEQELPFVIYSKPNATKMIAVLQKNSNIYKPSQAASGFVFAPFKGEASILISEKHAEVFVETIDFLQNPKPFTPNASFSEMDKSSFEAMVTAAVTAIHSNALEKVVLSRKELVKTKEIQPYELFKRLKSTYPDAFCYVWYHPKVGCWAGATPERFLKKSKQTIETVSLAGTQLFHENTVVNWSDKEIEEQQIVTSYIQSGLQNYCSEVHISETYTQKAGNLLHLKSDIKGELLSDADFIKVIQKLHPTPAVCGVPKDKALEFIDKSEGYDRTFYTGYLGEWLKDFENEVPNSSDLFVNLRCMKMEKNEAELFMGCGITKDSSPENEFWETVNKSQTMKRILAD